MRSLVTGGAGFVGSHLAARLLELGHEVSVIDDLSTGSIANISGLKCNTAFQYHIDTVFHRRLMAELIDESDVVFHLAAAVGVRLIMESPVRTLDTNVRGTEVVLELAAKKKKKVVITSTSEVYGKASKVPFHEDDNLVLGPSSRERWSYACSKLIDEFLALGYYREKGLPVVIVRLFNTVGPRQTGTYGMVLPRFVSQALTGDPITVYGTGDQRRCFTWVGDAVHALVQLATLPASVGSVFNVGSDQEITIRGLAELVKRVSGSSSPLAFVPYDEVYGPGFEDMFRRVPDLTRVRQAIGYRPTKKLDEIVRSVVESMTEKKSGNRAVASAAIMEAAVGGAVA